MANLRFEFRVLNDDGETIISDWTTFESTDINIIGAVETVEIHTGSALRAVRRDAMYKRGAFAEPVVDDEDELSPNEYVRPNSQFGVGA